MSDGKPDYAAIIASRKAPLPTVDLDMLRRRSAEATKATEVFQSAAATTEAQVEGPRVDAAAAPPAISENAGEPAEETSEPETARAPLRFSISAKALHQLRIQAAIENRSVPDLMRAMIADYLRKHGRLL